MDLELSSTRMYQYIEIWERPEIHKATFNRSYNILQSDNGGSFI